MLTVISGNAELALEKTSPEDPCYLNLQEILGAAGRSATSPVNCLPSPVSRRSAQGCWTPNETVAGLLTMLRRLIGENIELALIPGYDIWNIRIDPSQIDQILANLTVNARDAIAGVGKINIETASSAR